VDRQTLRVYADSSVYGGVFDEEFSEPSRHFFQRVRKGLFRLVLSDVVRREVADAPGAVRELLDGVLPDAEVVEVTTAALRARDAYLAAHIVARRHMNDALHVALATVSGCAMIVSWNFKHIVHYEKIPLYNAVNLQQGYGVIQIYSPLEVVGYGHKDQGEDI